MRIGEIIETRSTGFVAESYQLHRPPALGSLVKVKVDDNREVYAVVSYGETGGIEPGRRPVRWSTDEVFDEAIYDEHPELRRTLRTEFTALSVGSGEGEETRQGVPSEPPPMHYSVYSCLPEEIVRFTEELYYLRLLLSGEGPVPREQLLVTHLREVYRARGNDEEWLSRAAREIARLLKRDYDRLMTVLLGIEPYSGD